MTESKGWIMPTYTEAEVRAAIEELIKAHNLSWEEFLSLGESDDLSELDIDLDFAYRALIPSLSAAGE